MVDSVTNSSQQAVINPFQKRVDARELKDQDKKVQDNNKSARTNSSSETGKSDDSREAQGGKSKDLRVAANQGNASSQRTGTSRGSLVDVTV
jgi:hypothetical protein